MSERSSKIWYYYRKMRNDTYDHRVSRDKLIKFYHGTQLETDVKEGMENLDMTAVVVNTIRPFIKQRVALMTASSPYGKIYGYDKQDMDSAIALGDLLNYIQYLSNFQLVTEKVVLSQQREGVGYFLIHIDPEADFGRGEIKISAESYRNIFVDRNVKEWDYSDAPRVLHTRLYDEETFRTLYPEHAGEDISALYIDPDEILWDGENQTDVDAANTAFKSVTDINYIRIFDMYEKVIREQRTLQYMTGKIILIDENYTLSNTENKLIKDGTIKEKIFKVPRIVMSKAVACPTNYLHIDEVQLPISEYPIVPVVDEDTDNALHTGEIDYVYGLQDLKNKAFSLMMYNAAIAGSLRYKADAGQIQDANEINSIREELHKPGGIAKMTRSADGTWPLEEVRPEPLPPAFLGLVEHLTNDIQMGMSTFSLRSGDPSKVPETATMGLSLAEWSQDILRPSFNRLDLGIQRTMNIILQLIPSVYKEYKIFEITGEDGEPKQVSINEPQRDQNFNIINKMRDVTGLYCRYRIKSGSTLPVNTIAKLQLFKELAAINPVFIEHMIDYLPEIKDKEKEELKGKISVVPQLQQQVGQYQQAIEELTNKVKQLEENELDLMKRLEVEKTKTALAKQVSSAKVDIAKAVTSHKPSGTPQKGNKK